MAIVRGLPKFDNRAKFTTWSYRVATNACLDELRRRKRRPTPALVDEHDGWSEQTPMIREADFDETFVVRDEMQAALAKLPEDFRTPVVLRDCGGFDYAEIAETLGIPPGTVRSRIARGRSKLAEYCKPGTNYPCLNVRTNSHDFASTKR